MQDLLDDLVPFCRADAMSSFLALLPADN
jgi:hypothetical protein